MQYIKITEIAERIAAVESPADPTQLGRLPKALGAPPPRVGAAVGPALQLLQPHTGREAIGAPQVVDRAREDCECEELQGGR